MDKEAILKEYMICVCKESYSTREMADPDCAYCNYKDAIYLAMESYSSELKKEIEEKDKEIERLKELLDHAREQIRRFFR